MTRKLVGFHSIYQQHVQRGVYNKKVCLPPSPPRGCQNIYPKEEKTTPLNLLKAETFQYTAISDGIKRIYTNQDRVTKYGSTGIFSPNCVSYINLFINGILQPSSFYHVQEGILFLISDDIPEKGVPIILQFIIKIYNQG
jgi:hypothetical protein